MPVVTRPQGAIPSERRPGGRPRPAWTHADVLAAVKEGVIALAVFAGFALPVFWNTTVGRTPSDLWTGACLALVVLSVLWGQAYRKVDRRMLVMVLAYLALYAVGSLLSFWFVGDITTERQDLLILNAGLLTVGAFDFLFGAQLGADRRWGVPLGAVAAYVFIGVYVVSQRDVLLSQDTITRLNAEELFVEYKQLGDSFAICSLMLLGYLRPADRWLRTGLLVAYAVVTLLVLFMIPSRSAAILGGIALLIGILMRLPVRQRIIVALGTVCAGIAVAGLPWPLITEGTRFAILVNDPARDPSLLERLAILREGLYSIGENPLLGHWAFQLERLGSADAPIQNALDIWAQAGLVPFVLFIVMWVVALRLWWRRYRSSRVEERDWAERALPPLLFALLSWTVSRHAGYVLPLFCLGYAAALRGRRPQRNRSKDSSDGGPPPMVEPAGSIRIDPDWQPTALVRW